MMVVAALPPALLAVGSALGMAEAEEVGKKMEIAEEEAAASMEVADDAAAEDDSEEDGVAVTVTVMISGDEAAEVAAEVADDSADSVVEDTAMDEVETAETVPVAVEGAEDTAEVSSSPSSSQSSSSSSPSVSSESLSVPVTPPVTPAASNLATASDLVSHARLVPALLTSGRAKHCRVLAQGETCHCPATHCAKPVAMQAWAITPAIKEHRQAQRSIFKSFATYHHKHPSPSMWQTAH